MCSKVQKLNVLSEIAGQLNEAGITWAAGGSAMLYLNHIAEEFNDLDLMIMNKDADEVRRILLNMGTLHASKSNISCSSECFMEFTVKDVDVDVMAGFYILKDGIYYDRSLRAEDIECWVTVNGQSIPLHSVNVWRRNYELMGRKTKVELIDCYAEKKKHTVTSV
ncbi:MAG: hypothetical protein EOM64_01195 [Erysipelotrichia bacterium]|nr:hypothetical protein [Erysipelotrichia bacterium]